MPQRPQLTLLAPILLTLTLACDPDKTIDSCRSSTAIVDAAGAPTGFERCADGTIHRVAALSTDIEHTESSCPYTEADADDYELHCLTDADCTEAANGLCAKKSFGEGPSGCGCSYACASDADCAAGEACVPDGLEEDALKHSTCVPANCRTDADCAGGECGLSIFNDDCGWTVALACRSDADECRLDRQCGRDEECAIYLDAPAWACAKAGCMQ